MIVGMFSLNRLPLYYENVTCTEQHSTALPFILERDEFSNSLNRTAHLPEEAKEFDGFFHSTCWPHLHITPTPHRIVLPTPSAYSISHFSMAFIVTVKNTHTFNHSLYRWQTISISPALFSLIGNRAAPKPRASPSSFRCEDSIHQPCTSLLPAPDPETRQKGSAASTAIRSFSAQGRGVLASVIGFQAMCLLRFVLLMRFKLYSGTMFYALLRQKSVGCEQRQSTLQGPPTTLFNKRFKLAKR